MVVRRIGWVADQLQRWQAVWATVPEGAKKWIGRVVSGAVAGATTWLVGKMTSAHPFVIYVGVVVTVSAVVVAYAALVGRGSAGKPDGLSTKPSVSDTSPLDVTFSWDAEGDDGRHEYESWVHATFIIKSMAGVPAQRTVEVAAHIDIEVVASGKKSRRLAVIGGDDGFVRSDYLDTHRQYQVPVAVAVGFRHTLWVDKARGHSKTTEKGCYLTDSLFFSNPELRKPVKRGAYRARVVLVIYGHDYPSDYHTVTT